MVNDAAIGPAMQGTQGPAVSSRAEPEVLVAELFDRYQPAIFAYLHRLVGARDWAEELTQETFLRAHNACRQLPDISNQRAWLYRVATNLAFNALKRRRRFKWLPLSEVADAHHQVEDACEQLSRRSAVEDALGALPPGYRAPLLLYSYQGFTVAEVAAALDLSVGAVKVRLYRAREMFKKAYKLGD